MVKQLHHAICWARWMSALVVLMCVLCAGQALADESKGLRLGGHMGFGVPIATLGTVDTTLVGRDHAAVGIIAGVNLGIDEHWALNFEFIAISNFKDASAEQSATTFVFDPGVVYNWGSFWTGLRMAMRVPAPLGGAEFGLIPIIGKAFKISDKVSYYIELDLPTFIHQPQDVTFTTFIQTGFGF